MPEGDTVYRAARLLDRALSGQQLVRSDLRVPQHATADLTGGTVLATVSRGKHLLTRIEHPEAPDGGWTLHTHLKMEGAWRVVRPGRRWPRPAHQARVVLGVRPAGTSAGSGAQPAEETVAVGFSLGIVELLPTAAEHDVVGHLGPDLLGPDWSETEAIARLVAEPARALGEALLDQRNLAGIGNMYQAELCFVAGLHPRTPVGEVAPDRLRRLVRRAQLMLDVNKERPTQATTGDLREPLWVYRRDRSAYRRCGTPIRVAMVGPEGRERASYWCPTCQPAPADVSS